MLGKKVYIIILNYNNWSDTLACCDSVLQIDYPFYKVVVCDNASVDGSMDRFADWKRNHNSAPVIFLDTGENLGYAGGNNVGIRYALKDLECAYIWLLNNDTVVDIRALSALVEEMEVKPGIGLCGSLLRYYAEPEHVQAVSGKYNRYWSTSVYNTDVDAIGVYDYPVGASMMASRSFIEQVGLLSEDYFLYYEELDWMMRARGRYSVGFVQESVVYHKESATIGGKANPKEKSMLSDFYAMRNRIVFTRKFFPRYLPIVYVGLIISLLKRAKRGQWERVRMIWDIIWRMPESYFSYREHRG